MEYDRVLNHAEHLPTIVWIRTRPAGCSVLSGWWRLPRLTVGTSLFVLRHVGRSTEALLRLHARREALGCLDERGTRDREALETFRESLRPVRWKWVVAGVVATAVVAGRALVELFARFLDLFAFGLSRGFDKQQSTAVRATARAAADGLVSLSSSLSPSSVSDEVNHLLSANIGSLFILAMSFLTAVYCVLRPFSAAFRIKRMLFNLADEDRVPLLDSASTWHISRSVGIYARERAFNLETEKKVAKEVPFDLGLSTLATGLMAWGFASFYFTTESADANTWIPTVGMTAYLAALRFGWLWCRYVERTGFRRGMAMPQFGRLRVTGQIVDARPPTESMAMSLSGNSWLMLTVWLRQAQHLDRMLSELELQKGMPVKSRGGVLAAMSGILYLFFPPVAVAIRIMRLRTFPEVRLRQPSMIVMAVSGTVMFMGLLILGLSDLRNITVTTVLIVALLVSFTSVGGVAQAVNNQLVLVYADPFPLGQLDIGAGDTRVVFNPPPGWPPPPEGWAPRAGWSPDPSWPRPPEDWRLWLPPREASWQDNH